MIVVITKLKLREKKLNYSSVFKAVLRRFVLPFNFLFKLCVSPGLERLMKRRSCKVFKIILPSTTLSFLLL